MNDKDPLEVVVLIHMIEKLSEEDRQRVIAHFADDYARLLQESLNRKRRRFFHSRRRSV